MATQFPVIARVTQVLPPKALTLSPLTDADRAEALRLVLPRWRSDDDGRFVIRPVRIVDGEVQPTRVRLTNRWQTIATWDGPLLQIRASDCGGDCYCAGEFRFLERA